MRLAQLLEIPVLQRLTEANYRANGMPIGIIDAVDGSILVGFGWQEICTLFHRVHPQTMELCRESDDHIKSHLSEEQPCEYVCKNGLRDIGVPIIVSGQHLATLFLGQFFYEGETPDREFFLQRAREIGFDEAAYLAALDRVPVFDRRVVANILQFNQALARFIADLAERSLERARNEQALRDVDRRRSEFIAVLSHELRNPLAPIQNALYLLERADPRSDQARRAFAVANRQLRHLSRILDDVLDVMRLSQAKTVLRRERVDLAQVVRDTVEDHLPLSSERALALDLDEPGEPVWVDGDSTRLAQVIGNVLRNALKFTDAGGRVRVAVERREGEAVVRVRDDGIGIAPDVLPRMFEPFAQGDTSLDRSRGGLGLGLSLARGLVEAHGGAISAHSEGAGKGAELVVRLPLSPPEARAEPGAATATHRRSVLVIEDNEDTAATLRDVLESEGHEVHVAPDGLTGVDAALRLRPEVVLCDIGLPGIDGYEVARRLRDARPAMRLVAVTGYASPADVGRAAGAGFHRHVAKPLDLETLMRIVAESPGGRGAAAQRGPEAHGPAVLPGGPR